MLKFVSSSEPFEYQMENTAMKEGYPGHPGLRLMSMMESQTKTRELLASNLAEAGECVNELVKTVIFQQMQNSDMPTHYSTKGINEEDQSLQASKSCGTECGRVSGSTLANCRGLRRRRDRRTLRANQDVAFLVLQNPIGIGQVVELFRHMGQVVQLASASHAKTTIKPERAALTSSCSLRCNNDGARRQWPT